MRKKSIVGFTIMLTFGSWGGINVHASSYSARLCLGFVALQLVFRDFENVIEICLDSKEAKIKQLEEKLSNHTPNTGIN